MKYGLSFLIALMSFFLVYMYMLCQCVPCPSDFKILYEGKPAEILRGYKVLQLQREELADKVIWF